MSVCFQDKNTNFDCCGPDHILVHVSWGRGGIRPQPSSTQPKRAYVRLGLANRTVLCFLRHSFSFLGRIFPLVRCILVIFFINTKMNGFCVA